MERTASTAGPTFGVAPGGDLEGGGVRLDDRVEERIEPLDAAQIRLGQLDAAQAARNHEPLEFEDRGLEPRSGLVSVGAWRQSVVDRHILAARESTTRAPASARVEMKTSSAISCCAGQRLTRVD